MGRQGLKSGGWAPAPQYLSMDPRGGEPVSVVGPHPEARIGVDPFGEHRGLTGEDRPVTLGDLWDEPEASIQRIGRIVKKCATDPKTWVGLAAMYFGPKVLPLALPAIGQAVRSTLGGGAAVGRGVVRGTAAIGDVVSPDVVGILSPRLGKVLDVAQRARAALPTPTAATEPPPVPAPVPSGPPPAMNEPAGPDAPPTRPRPIHEAMEAAIRPHEAKAAAIRASSRATAPAAPPAPATESPAPTRPAAAPPSPQPMLSAAGTPVYLRLPQQGERGH